MIKKRHAIISVALALVLVLGTFTCMAFTVSAEDDDCPLNDHGLVKDIEGGNILHCWCWNFNTIKNNIPQIAAAGFSAVQTSPINEVLKGESGGMQIFGQGKWYYHYQPTDYKIGNYQLGTENEFKSMCETAHSYGVKVIVDVVANHTTPTYSAVSDTLKNIEGGLYHTAKVIAGNNRFNMTQTSLGGLPDCNTQNKNYQNLILDYLNQCIADGADGFRFDAAKHIELPSDDESYGSDFWPTVLENGSTFQYGEVLQSEDDNFIKYSKLMHVTASTHGGTLRTYFKDGCSTIGATSFIAYNGGGVKGNRLVTWVESHDTYANDEDPDVPSLSSFWLTNDEIRRGWALIGSRKNSTSLFFNRPACSQPTTQRNLNNNPRWGNNQIGVAGDNNWNHPEVVAVNKFRNAMWGESEKLENIKSNKKYIMITRGTRGAVIINNSDSDLVLSGQATTVVDGSYTDKAHSSEFTVSDGKLSGTVKAKEIAVIYDDSIQPTYPTEAPTTQPTETSSQTQPTETSIQTQPTETSSQTQPTETSSQTQPTETSSQTQPTETSSETQPSEAPETTIKISAKKKTIYVGDSTKVTATVTNPQGATSFKSSNTAVATVKTSGDTATVTGKKAGSVIISAANNGKEASVKITISKKANPMTVKAKSCTASTKKNSTIKKAKAFTIKNAKGKVAFKKASGDKKIKINNKTGNITVKKGLKKGKTYSLKVKVTAAGNTEYMSVTKSVTVKIKIK